MWGRDAWRLRIEEWEIGVVYDRPQRSMFQPVCVFSHPTVSRLRVSRALSKCYNPS